MTIELLSALILALAINELIHNAFEIWGARQKVQWLTHRIDQKPHGDWPINVDTWLKTILVHKVLLVVIVSMCWLALVALRLSPQSELTVACGVLLLSYGYTVFAFDRFHRDIGQLLRRYKRK